MPGGRPPIPSSVRDEILARVARGEYVTHICRDPGLSNPASVCQWARQDAWFGQRYREAQAKGAYLRARRFDPGKAQAVLNRLADGERLQAILVGPAMPNKATYRLWLQNEPEFAEAVFRVRREWRADRAEARRRRLNRLFDPRLADRIVARAAEGVALRQLRRLHPELPGAPTLARWRREQPDFDRVLKNALRVANSRRQRARLCNDAVIEAVTDRVFDGETLNAIGRDPAMPCAETLYAWLRKRPDFYMAMEAALHARADLLADQALDLAEDRKPGRSEAVGGLKIKVKRLDERAGKVGPGELWRRPRERIAGA